MTLSKFRYKPNFEADWEKQSTNGWIHVEKDT